ncbi:hypothetical protein KJ682_16060 [bacterium]|nr:hypothetical protein [bacterium]
MGNERIIRTFILAVIGLAAFALWRPNSPDPTEDVRSRETRFFITKAHQDRRFDAVIYGDSRGLRGLSPAVIGDQVPGLRIYNFSWNAGGMNRDMYAEAEKLLDPASQSPALILVPTALSFMSFKRSNSQFNEYRHKPWDQVMLYRHLPRVADWFQPVSPSVYPRKVLDIRPYRELVQVFHPDGWIETDQTPLDDLAEMTVHEERLEGNSVDPELIRDFMAQTADWTARGIRVFACFLPAHPPRVTLEDSILGFDKDAFRADFARSGGIWLDLPQTGFESYDGSHLTASSARRVSALLGEALASEMR